MCYFSDSDGDLIAFSSDDELTEALGFVNDGVFRVYIHTKDANNPNKNQTFHPGVVCDGCKDIINGDRYKCVVCADYDLCSVCEDKGTHAEHCMLLLRTPEQRQQLNPARLMVSAV